MTTLTLHQGDTQQEFVQHPVEVARVALYAAAEIEGGEWASVILRFASALPNRPRMQQKREEGGDA